MIERLTALVFSFIFFTGPLPPSSKLRTAIILVGAKKNRKVLRRCLKTKRVGAGAFKQTTLALNVSF